jgi:ProP effector
MGSEQLAAIKAQLTEGAESGAQSTSRLTSTPVGVRQEVKRPPKPSRTSAEAAARAVNTFQRHFPHAFPHASVPKVPLKVGILEDVLSRAESLGLSERDARNGVKLWCRGQRYWACLVEGNVRVDLAGTSTGVVTAVEAEYGTLQEKTRLARRREKMRKNRHTQSR